MAKCEELNAQECKFLEELEAVFRNHKNDPVINHFQIAHKITQRIERLGHDEELVMKPDVPGQKKFKVRKQKTGGKAGAAGADPCCFWEWEDPPGEFVCVGGCD